MIEEVEEERPEEQEETQEVRPEAEEHVFDHDQSEDEPQKKKTKAMELQQEVNNLKRTLEVQYQQRSELERENTQLRLELQKSAITNYRYASVIRSCEHCNGKTKVEDAPCPVA